MGLEAQNNLKIGKTDNATPASSLTNGIKRDEIKSLKEQSIFDKADVDHNNILTGDEITKFHQEISATTTSTPEDNATKTKLEYDANGNTKGIIVQNGETIEALAQKFGCTKEALIALNKDILNGKKYFNVGDSIKVPGKIAEDSTALQGRKSADGAMADYKAAAKSKLPKLRWQKTSSHKTKPENNNYKQSIDAKRAAAKAKKQSIMKSLGIVNTKGAGKVRVGYFGQKNLGNRKKSQIKYTVIGQTGVRGREIVKGSDGKYYTMAEDGSILKELYVKKTNFFDKSKKITGTMIVNGKHITGKFAVVGTLGKGRKAVIDSKGNSYVMSHDGKILSNTYLTGQRTSDAIRHNKTTAQKTTIAFLENSLNSAQKSFNAQMNKDGWAADTADFVSNSWGWAQEEGNQAWRVRKDLAQSRKSLMILKAAAKKGDAQFAATFKKLYGVQYNPNAVADYMSHPTEANYKKAFGNKNIVSRVARYNGSQDTGAEVVKTTAIVAAGIAATAIPGGLAVTALATGAASLTINSTDRLSSRQGLKKNEFKEILVESAFDAGSVLVGGGASKIGSAIFKGTTKELASGAAFKVLSKSERFGRVAVDVTGDMAYGAGQEYIETGHVTVEGTLINGATAVIGQGVESRAVKRLGTNFKNGVASSVKGAKGKLNMKMKPSTTPATSDVTHYITPGTTPTTRITHSNNDDITTFIEPNTSITRPIKVQPDVTTNIKAKPKKLEGPKVQKNFDEILSGVNKANSPTELHSFVEELNNKSITSEQRSKLQEAIRIRKNQLTNAAHNGKIHSTEAKVNDVSLKGRKKFKFGNSYVVSDNSKIKLAESYSLDLRDPKIRKRISELKDNEVLTVGRSSDADIRVSAEHDDVSREHCIIEKHNGKIYVTDISLNGSNLRNNGIRRASAMKGIVTREVIRESVEDEKKSILDNI